MLTAHLPSGYCLARATSSKTPYLVPALIGAVLPDLDLIFFYFVDGRSVHHHKYWLHIPAFWLAVGAVALPVSRLLGYTGPALIFLAAIFLHLALDTIAGGIAWLYPLDKTLYRFAIVPPTRSHWVWSFVFHWTFLLELVVWATAVILWQYRRERACSGPPSAPLH